MKRAEARHRIRSVVDEFALELASIVEKHVDSVLEQAFAQVGAALDGALSIAVGELARDEVRVVETVVDLPGIAIAKTAAKPRATKQKLGAGFADLANKINRERTALQANGKKPVTCTKCGYVGGNARGCGRAHPTQVTGKEGSSHGAAGPVRSAATPNRLAAIATVAKKLPPPSRPQAVEPDDDDEPDARWSRSRIKAETEIAESDKHDGELPDVLASFVFGDAR
jgi:hypothetical protein